MCKRIELKRAVFPELWVLQRYKTAKVAFSLTASVKAIDDRAIP